MAVRRARLPAAMSAVSYVTAASATGGQRKSAGGDRDTFSEGSSLKTLELYALVSST